MEIFDKWLMTIENPDHRSKMKELLDWIQKDFPRLGTVIKWNQPMFTDHGTFIIGFSTSKNHFSIGLEKPAVDEFKEEMEARGIDFSKMTVRVKWDESVDYELIKQLIAFQMEDKKECQTFWRK